MKRVIVVGGGYAGAALARTLDGQADVVLVEARDRFVHNVAAIRAIVEPSLFEKIAIPYDRLLKRGKLVRGRATAVTGKGVTLASGDKLEGDAVVIATGSHYARPFKPDTDNTATLQQAIAQANAQVKSAKRIAIVGAGAVGTELAGEIATTLSGKSIALISSTPTLFPGYTPKLGSQLATQLKRMGVKVHFGATAKNLMSTSEPFAGVLELSTGERIESDLVFPVIGARVEGTLLQTVPGATFDKLGRVNVDSWLRPSGDPTLFALGDAAAAGDAMTIVAIMRQQPWLTKTITAMFKGRKVESQPAYSPWPMPPILIPLGKRKGASVLPVTSNGLAVGPFLTSAIKGKSLFIPRYWKEFGYG